MLGWLRNYIRRSMPPIDPQVARKKKSQLALLYSLLAWNLVGLTVYSMLKENVPKLPDNSVDYAKMLGVKDTTVIQFSGFRKVGEFDVHLTEEEVEKFYKSKKEDKQEGVDKIAVVE